jgi:hypothetical protein
LFPPVLHLFDDDGDIGSGSSGGGDDDDVNKCVMLITLILL